MLVRFVPFALFLATISSIGCGNSSSTSIEKQKTLPVTGQINFKQKPVADASVSFLSNDGKVSAAGKTDASGMFKLTTYGTDEGAPAGSYKVVVAVSAQKELKPGVLAPEPPGGFKSPIPVIYSNPSSTTLKAQVKEGDQNHFVFDLK